MRFIATIFFLSTLLCLTHRLQGQSGQSLETGYAVYYADYLHGRKTSSGELYDRAEFTCAHRTHPFGTLLRVTRTDNNKSVVVRVNDRGPFGEGLVLDLSKVAAAEIGLLEDGRTRVQLEIVGFSNSNPKSNNNAYARTNPYTDPFSSEPTQPRGYDEFTEKTPVNTTPRNIYITRPSSVPNPYRYRNSGTLDEIPSGYEENSDNLIINPNTIASNNNRVNNASNVTGLVIQLGSFTNDFNANRALEDIQKKGLTEAYLVKRTINGKVYKKVVIGPYNNRTAAQSALQRARQQFRVEGLIVNL